MERSQRKGVPVFRRGVMGTAPLLLFTRDLEIRARKELVSPWLELLRGGFRAALPGR